MNRLPTLTKKSLSVRTDGALPPRMRRISSREARIVAFMRLVDNADGDAAGADAEIGAGTARCEAPIKQIGDLPSVSSNLNHCADFLTELHCLAPSGIHIHRFVLSRFHNRTIAFLNVEGGRISLSLSLSLGLFLSVCNSL